MDRDEAKGPPEPPLLGRGAVQPPEGLTGDQEAAFGAAIARAEASAESHAGQQRYKQELARSITVLGNIFITLSGVTPAASVFIIAPVALAAAGSGSFLSFVFAAIVGVFMAFCWAELSAAFPIAGGDYALVWHSFKGRASRLAGPVSFITFALYADFIAFIPATIALGAGTYFGVVANIDPRYIGAVIMIISAGVAMLKIALLPTWLGWVSLVLGILGFVPFGDFFALPAIGVWTLIVAGVIWFRTEPDGPLAVPPSSNLTRRRHEPVALPAAVGISALPGTGQLPLGVPGNRPAPGVTC